MVKSLLATSSRTFFVSLFLMLLLASCDPDANYYGLALDQRDVILCDRVGGEPEELLDNSKVSPEDFLSTARCYFEVGVLLNDSSVCHSIEPTGVWRDRCFTFFALSRRNYDLCESSECRRLVGLLTGDYLLCDKNGMFRDQCLRDISKKYPDADICGGIDRFDFRAECFTFVALDRGSLIICDEIMTEDMNLEDIRESYLRHEERLELADKITVTHIKAALDRYYKKCKHKVAVNTMNLSACVVPDEIGQGLATCYAGIASSSSNKSLCDKLPEVNLKMLCLREFDRLSSIESDEDIPHPIQPPWSIWSPKFRNEYPELASVYNGFYDTH